jgi:hypothetical protein
MAVGAQFRNALIRYSAATEAASLDSGRVAVLFGWAGATERPFAKHAALYHR